MLQCMPSRILTSLQQTLSHQGSDLEVFKAGFICSKAQAGLIWFAVHFIFSVHAH